MKKMKFLVFMLSVLVSMLFVAGLIWAQDEEGDATQSVNKYEFEQGDVIASQDGDYWYVGKIMETGGTGRDREFKVLFANGEEAWVAPSKVKKNPAMIRRDDLKIGRQVFYTTQDSSDFNNNSIRYTTFNSGKITSIGKLHRNIIAIGTNEVKWNEQVITAK